MEIDALLVYQSVIYNYYPKDIDPSDINYVTTPEITRQWELIENARANNQNFTALIGAIGGHLEAVVEDLSLRGGIFDLSYKALIHLPGRLKSNDYNYCLLALSVVSPYYLIYFTKFHGVGEISLSERVSIDNEVPLYDTLNPMIENYYPGYKEFPTEHFNNAVPGILSAKRNNQNATYFECLITDVTI